jgi:hypothetical protein
VRPDAVDAGATGDVAAAAGEVSDSASDVPLPMDRFVATDNEPWTSPDTSDVRADVPPSDAVDSWNPVWVPDAGDAKTGGSGDSD